MFRQSGDSIESHKSLMSPEKRLFTQHMMATDTNGVGQDTTDNVRHFRTTKYIHTMSSTTTTKKIVDDVEVQQQHKTGSIAQHVERLFGPGALAQGFHTNRRSGENGQTTAVLTEKSMNSRNFFSPVVKMTRKEAIANGGAHEKNGSTKNGDGMENLKEMEVTLPVLRHLRPEFREQLPICASPRRYVPPTRENHSSPQIANGTHYPMETNHLIETPTNDIQVNKTEEMQQHEFGEKIGDAHALVIEETGVTKDKIKDGNYFLDIMGKERGRILSLADKIDGYMEQVKAKEDTEEIIGYIRAASGKARLLAAQKMKQFEGLCHSNLNQKPGEKFQTTGEDLQGFWDMVMLQVNHVDSLFDEIETLKVNNWKKKPIEAPVPPQGAKLTRKPVATKGNSSTASNQSQASSKKSAAAALAAQKREAQRKQFMELKRKQRTAMNQAQNEDTTNGTGANNVDQA